MKMEKICPKCGKGRLEFNDSVRWYICEHYLKCGFVETQKEYKKREAETSIKKYERRRRKKDKSDARSD